MTPAESAHVRALVAADRQHVRRIWVLCVSEGLVWASFVVLAPFYLPRPWLELVGLALGLVHVVAVVWLAVSWWRVVRAHDYGVRS